jgi:hypothetical protein
MAFKHKAVSTHIEFMFTRSMFQTEDLQKQHEILNEVAENRPVATLEPCKTLQPRLLETGKAIGKIVLEGFLICGRICLLERRRTKPIVLFMQATRFKTPIRNSNSNQISF